jgi:hypothetical protein
VFFVIGCSRRTAGDEPYSKPSFSTAIEDAGVGCFILRANPKNLLTTAVSRWQIQPMHSKIEDGFPGLGHPRWQVKLLKVRNGKPGPGILNGRMGAFIMYPGWPLFIKQYKNKQVDMSKRFVSIWFPYLTTDWHAVNNRR